MTFLQWKKKIVQKQSEIKSFDVFIYPLGLQAVISVASYNCQKGTKIGQNE